MSESTQTTPSGEVILYDRSRSTTDWGCARRRYYNYEYDGRGVVPDVMAMALFNGSVIHDGLSTIAHFHRDASGKVDIDTIASTAHKQIFEALVASGSGKDDEIIYANEQAALIEGMLRGFHKFVWPRLIATYPTILAIEQEMAFNHDISGKAAKDGGYTFMAKPDLVMATPDGEPVYIEYKTTATKKDEWINSWSTGVQLHSTCRAIEETLGIKPLNVVVQGLYKGYVSYGKQSSPFCYAYHRSGNPPFTKAETTYEYRAGLRRVPTWELDGGVKKWVESMPDNVLADQFPQTPPIFLNDSLIDAFFAQRAIRELEIKMAKQMLEVDDDPESRANVLNGMFPQKFDACNPGWGTGCAYRSLCFGHIDDPLTAGYSTRVSHHGPETDRHTKDDENEAEAV